MVSKLVLVLSWWPWTCLSSPGMDTAGGMGQLDGELAPWATRAAGLKQVCLCCLAALICFPSACLLAWQALRRLQTTCCTVCASNVNEACPAANCWYCCTFETMLAMVVVRAHGLSALIRTPVALRTDGTRSWEVSLVLYPSYVSPRPCSRRYVQDIVARTVRGEYGPYKT